MRAKVKYAVFVKEDIFEAVNWYNQSQKGLGNRFLKNVREKIDYLAKNPEKIQLRYQDIRMTVVKVFPYTIHYQYFKEKNVVIVIGVFHTSISPDKWTKRLK